MEKWNSIAKLNKKTNTTMDIFIEADWVCTDFGSNLSNTEELTLVLQPLQVHPYGKEFGYAPTGLSCWFVTESQFKEYFIVQENRSYRKEQKKYNKDYIE